MSSTPSPKVTLFLPTLRRPEFLKHSLASVLAQDYEDMEILVSDNGSEDGTADLIEQMTRGDHRVRFLRNPKTVRAFEHGRQRLADARGKYFVVVCDDDWVGPGFVRGLVEALEKNPGASLAIPRTETMDLNGATTGHAPLPPWDVCPGDFFLLDWAYRFHPFPLHTCITYMAETAFWRQVGLVHDFAAGIHSDNWLIITLALRGQVAFASDALFRYRIHGTSMNISAPLDALRTATVQLKAAMRTDPFFREGFHRLPGRMQKFLRQAIYHAAAGRYLAGVRHLHPLRMPLALLRYPWDAEYAALIWSTMGKVRRLATRGNPAPAAGTRN